MSIMHARPALAKQPFVSACWVIWLVACMWFWQPLWSLQPLCVQKVVCSWCAVMQRRTAHAQQPLWPPRECMLGAGFGVGQPMCVKRGQCVSVCVRGAYAPRVTCSASKSALPRQAQGSSLRTVHAACAFEWLRQLVCVNRGGCSCYGLPTR